MKLLPAKVILQKQGHIDNRLKNMYMFSATRGKSQRVYIFLNSTTLVKLKATDPSQTTVALLPKEDSPHMVNSSTLATVIFRSRTWSPGKNTMVMLEVKYSPASCANSESVTLCVVRAGGA